MHPGNACPGMQILTRKNDSIKVIALCSVELLMTEISTGSSECLSGFKAGVSALEGYNYGA